MGTHPTCFIAKLYEVRAKTRFIKTVFWPFCTCLRDAIIVECTRIIQTGNEDMTMR